MAKIRFSFEPVHRGIRCTGWVKFSCGYEIEESMTSTKPIEREAMDDGRASVREIIALRLKGHAKVCRREH